MSLTKSLLAFVILFSLIACSSISVTTDYDPEQNFASYKTFRMYEGKPVPGDALAANPLVKKRVVAGVEKALKEKGFENVASDNADFVVVLHAGIKERMQITDWGGYGWYRPWWGAYGGGVDVSYYDEASLVIDMVDSEEKELVWRGIGTEIVKGTGSDQEAIDQTVARILREFPPVKK